MADDFDEWKVHLEAHEGLEGVVTIVRVARAGLGSDEDPRALADALVVQRGQRALGSRWQLVSAATFEAQLRENLTTGLAYDVPMLPHDEASAAAQALLRWFGPAADCTYLVNGTRSGWNPVTASTFEQAHVIVGRDHVGLFLFEQED